MPITDESDARRRIAVTDLVDRVLSEGDLLSAWRARALQHEDPHRSIQSGRGKGYEKEKAVSTTLEAAVQGGDSPAEIQVHGRIDGVFRENGVTVVEEIKTCVDDAPERMPHERHPHLAQAKIYAYMYAVANGLSQLDVQLTYYQLSSRKAKSLRKSYSLPELADFFRNMIDSYREEERKSREWRDCRNRSIENLSFPFPTYREGQKPLAAAVFRGIRDGSRLFVRAATGSGKTMATLYPSLKAIAAGACDKIFYLTARTTAQQNAENALEILKDRGLRVRYTVLTGKEKVCFRKEEGCYPESCPYALGYYDRIRQGMSDVAEEEAYRRQTILSCAQKHMLCPFELSLDLSVISDCVICDYNYLFDPQVYLRRFFLNPGQRYVFLVDEAHNLVERSRSMFSAGLEKKEILRMKRLLGRTTHPDLHSELSRINRILLGWRKRIAETGRAYHAEQEMPEELIGRLKDLRSRSVPLLGDESFPHRAELLDLTFRLTHMIRISELFDEHFAATYECRGSNLKVKLLCIDSSQLIAEITAKGAATVFFSATLLPFEYYFKLFGGTEDDVRLDLPSPFPSENLCLCLAANVSTRYRHRSASFAEVTEYVRVMVEASGGNSLIYFPSYRYMEEVCRRFADLDPASPILLQTRDMSEEARARFLSGFRSPGDQPLTGFAVMGGIFGEGIDLVGDRLSAAAVVGAGIPPPDHERELLRGYFEATLGRGFDFAYTFPGWNRVLQAAGRVIRSETDRGAVLLVDDRLNGYGHRGMFPPEWRNIQTLQSPEELRTVLRRFRLGGEEERHETSQQNCGG